MRKLNSCKGIIDISKCKSIDRGYDQNWLLGKLIRTQYSIVITRMCKMKHFDSNKAQILSLLGRPYMDFTEEYNINYRCKDPLSGLPFFV